MWINQLYYNCTNKLQGDTLFFIFSIHDFEPITGRGGGNEINAGKIKIPQKGKLIGKAVIKSGQLIFVFKVKKMELGDTYTMNNEFEQTN